MKTYLRTTMAALAIATLLVERIAAPLPAQEPAYWGPPSAVGGVAGQQPLPAYPGGPAYGPNGYPGGPACGPACGPYPCPDGCGPAMCPDGCGCCEDGGYFGTGFLLLACAGQWRLSADAVLLRRSSPEAQTLFRNGFGSNSAGIFDAEQLKFDMEAGFSVSASRCGAIGLDVELIYTQVDAFRASALLNGNVFLETDVNGGNFTVLNPQVENTSVFRSGEGNFWWHVGERTKLLGGFRWIGFEDHYNVTSIGANIPASVTLSNNATNNLYGGQIGADFLLLDWERITINAAAKVGAYGNACRQTSRQVDAAIFKDQEIAGSGHHAAFLGEINVLGTVEVVMDRLFLHAGYRVLWIDGVLLAPEQIDVNNFATGAAGLRFGTLFMHGLNAGMELRY